MLSCSYWNWLSKWQLCVYAGCTTLSSVFVLAVGPWAQEPVIYKLWTWHMRVLHNFWRVEYIPYDCTWNATVCYRTTHLSLDQNRDTRPYGNQCVSDILMGSVFYSNEIIALIYACWRFSVINYQPSECLSNCVRIIKMFSQTFLCLRKIVLRAAVFLVQWLLLK